MRRFFPPRQRSSGRHRLDRRAPGGPESRSGAVRPACTRMPVLASEETARDCPRHPRPYGVLSAGRRSNGPGLPSRAPPVCASPRLVSPNEGGIHQDIFTVWIIGKGLEYPFPDTGLRPPVLALEYTVPCTDAVRELASCHPLLPWVLIHATQPTLQRGTLNVIRP